MMMTNMKTAHKRRGRKVFQRLVAMVLLMTVVVNVTLTADMLAVFAQGETGAVEQDVQPVADVTNDDLQISGNNAFGNLLTDTIQNYNSGNGSSTSDSPSTATEGYSVTGIEMDGKTATVAYNAVEECTLVVGVYTEDGVKMLGSGKVTTDPEKESAQVTIVIDEMPQYYLVKAFLVKPANNYPLSDVYTCELYTKSIQKVINSTIEDYPDREILNLDGDDTTNFAVYGLGVEVIEQSEDKNIYNERNSDPENGKYVFNYADEEFASLKVGDVFSHEDDMDIIIAKVASIETVPNADGTYTVTIIEDDDIDMEDVFDYVKIENNGKINSYTIDDSVADECVQPVSDENNEPASGSAEGIRTQTVSPKTYKAIDISGEYDSINIERKIYSKKKSTNSDDTLNLPNLPPESTPVVANVEISLNLKIKVRISLKVYISLSESYIEFKLGDSLSLNGKISGEVTVNPFTLCQVGVSPVPGVYITFEPKPEFSASASLTIDLSYEHSVGFKCSTKGGLSKLDSKPVAKLCVGIEGKIFFGMNFKPALKILSEYVAEASMTAKVGIEIIGNVLNFDTSLIGDSKHDCKCCVDGECNFVLELKATVKFFENKSFTGNIVPQIKFKLFDWYYSIDHGEIGFGSCPYIKYKTMILVQDVDGNAVENADIWIDSTDADRIGKTNEKGICTGYISKGEHHVICSKDNKTQDDTITIKPSPCNITITWFGDQGNVVMTGSCGRDIIYTLYYSGLLVFSGNGKMYDYPDSSKPWLQYREKIQRVKFYGNISSVCSKQFFHCPNLVDIVIPDTVVSIGDMVFGECSSLTEIPVSTGNKKYTSVDGILYDIGKKKLLACPAGRTGIVIIPNTVVSIEEGAFYGCSNLTSVIIPNSVELIGHKAFYNCCSLTDITIPDSVTSIGLYAFSFCSSIKKITIPNSVLSIGSDAFSNCSSLTSISIPDSVESIGVSSFNRCFSLTDIAVSPNNKKYSSIDGVLYDRDKDTLITFPGGKTDSSIISDSITSIANYAFSDHNITHITIPNRVKSIGYYAFSFCMNLTSITIPSSVTTIKADAFWYCDNLTDVYYSGSQEEWNKISIGGNNTPLMNATIHYNYTPASSGNASLGGATMLRTQSTSAIQTATFDNLVPNANYLLVVSKSSSLGDMLDEDNLLFIDEKRAGDTGKLTFGYQPREDYEGAAVLIFGPIPEIIPATGITLSNPTLNLEKGDTAILTATVTPNGSTDTVAWSSSDESVVTVANGTVTAVGKGNATITATAGDFSATCTVTVTEPAPVTYSLSPNVNGGASKLFEPWGLRYYASFDGEDSAHIRDRGFAILKDTYYTEEMTPEVFRANANAHVFLQSRGELEYVAPTEKYPSGRYAATLTEGVYSYDIGAKYYVVSFAVMDNDQTIFGAIKSNSMQNILTKNLNSSAVSDTEKAISRCILALKETVAEHYAAMGVPSASHDMVIPRGSSQTAAPSVASSAQSGIMPNITAGAARLIEPWGLRYYATYTANSNIADRGVVMLNEASYTASYAFQPDQMRMNPQAYVFRESDGTLAYDEGSQRYAATLTEGISSKNIADLYYVVPFVILKDGSYVYGTVKSNAMKNILTKNQSKDSVPETEKAVSRDIISLYEAVKAYYEA